MDKVTAIKLKCQQGKLQFDIYANGATESDFDDLAAMIEASGEVAVVGYSVISEKDPKPTIVGGTPGVILKDTTLVLGRDSASAIYVSAKLPEQDSDLTNVVTNLNGQTIGGSTVTGITKKSMGTKLA